MNRVFVLAPTVDQAKRVARDFGIPEQNIATAVHALYGKDGCTVLLYNEYQFDNREELFYTLGAGNHTLVRVPEYSLISRLEK